MSDTNPTYDELVDGALKALDTVASIIDSIPNEICGENPLMLAEITVAAAQVFATLAQAAATKEDTIAFQERQYHGRPFRPVVKISD